MPWVFLAIVSLLFFGLIASDFVQLGGVQASVRRNSPTTIQNMYGVISLVGLLMTTVFMQSTATRDYACGIDPLIFSKPIRRRDYFFGKFFGAYLIALIPTLGVTIGTLIGPWMPWVQPHRYGPVSIEAHVLGFFGLVVPNTLFTGAIIYALAVTFRSNLVSYVGAMLILVLYVIGRNLGSGLESRWLGGLVDPLGGLAMQIANRYRTIAEQNAGPVGMSGAILANRLLWTVAAVAILGLFYSRFRFSDRPGLATSRWGFGSKRSQGGEVMGGVQTGESGDGMFPTATAGQQAIGGYRPSDAGGFSWSRLGHLIWAETKGVVTSQAFLIIVILGMLNMAGSLASFKDLFDSRQYPVTYNMVDLIRGGFYLFLIGLITFYSGVILWRGRDARMQEIIDATPTGTVSFLVAKVVAMLLAIGLILLSTIVVGVTAQTLAGYTRYELPVYFKSLMVLDWLQFAFMAVSAILLQVLLNQRYAAYFGFILVLVLFAFAPLLSGVTSNLVIFGGVPSSIYSDMNGFGPFVPGLFWFNLYWVLVCLLLLVMAYLFYVRGNDIDRQSRWAESKRRLRGAWPYGVSIVALLIGCGGWVYYNTDVLNRRYSREEIEGLQKGYEQAYKRYQGVPQPRFEGFEFAIDIDPQARDLEAVVTARACNRNEVPIDRLHFTLPPQTKPEDVSIEIPGGKVEVDDPPHRWRSYRLDKPLGPGEAVTMTIRTKWLTPGFENQTSTTSLTQNGTFFNNGDIVPAIGYSADREVTDPGRRKKLGLPERTRMPQLDPTDMVGRGNHYIAADSDWVTMRTVISTSIDQIAVAPGSLKREWSEGGRRYFEYELDHPSLNFYSFISARYEVAREKWNGIDLEVYHIPEHAYNVPRMLDSIRKSLAYYTEHYGPYRHRQCRIIEFPRYATFAQAFPGTMPYSEGIGFISDLREIGPEEIDPVFYVVSHEMAHQYWAHQVIGANMQGSEMLSESFSNYSALMVMEREYGKENMRKFLTHELDSYLAGRAGESQEERPLARAEGQAYIHYNKGSLVLYYLKEMIGEANVNRALRGLVERFGYRDPPYPTSADAIAAFREVTPAELQYLIDDWFENITIFSSEVVEATYRREGDAYVVEMVTRTDKYRVDGKGNETAVEVNDFIDVAVFAEPESGEGLGKPLVQERRRLTGPEHRFTFRVNAPPHQAGIDPYNLLIDRQPNRHLRRVTEQ